MRGRWTRVAVVASLPLWLLACVPFAGGWRIEALEARYPALRDHAGHRLADATASLWPDDTGAILFLCRFDRGTPLGVSLPSDASPDERAAIRLALGAWAKAGLGVRFQETGEEQAAIRIRFEPPGADSRTRIRGSGLTVTDCVVDREAFLASEADAALDARLVRALIVLRRTNPDMIGRAIPMNEDERVGSVLHEIGHALGFAGHVGTLDSVMASATDTVRRFGRRVRNGESFEDPSLSALYALPNGVRVGRAQVSARFRTDWAAAQHAASRRGWRGPFVRVGQRNAQLHWRHAGRIVGRLFIDDYVAGLRAGARLDFSDSRFVRTLRSQPGRRSAH